MYAPSPSSLSVSTPLKRRNFLAACASFAASGGSFAHAATKLPEAMSFGLVTYQWAKNWDLPTLIANCETAGIGAVELRSTHAHGVEPELSKTERDEVRRRFADSSVTCVGPGSDERFDSPDPEKLRAAIERTKAFLQLSHDIGSSGVKVKPDRFWPDVPEEKTIAQIAASLREVADFAKNLGQQVRLEVHGQLAAPTTIVEVMKACDHPQARLCWNCNPQDLETGEGFESNLRLALPWFGDTVHVHELDGSWKPYPYDQLFRTLKESGYKGWCLLETSTTPKDTVAALKAQQAMFDAFLSR
ncbi:MAG: sugar phosphate isomerase/epimerase [Verrucomicrobiae bacterium]|nr:sugar phosphate isomerase/epimerase [Verrucomicrobiae bacterium]